MRNEFLCISVLRVASVPRAELVSCKSALNRPVVHSTDCSKAVFPLLVLLRVVLWFTYDLATCFMTYLVLICSCVFLSF